MATLNHLNFVAFDLETSKITPDAKALRTEYDRLKASPTSDPTDIVIARGRYVEAKEIRNFRPLGISCASTHFWVEGKGKVQFIWHGKPDDWGSLARLPDTMSPKECQSLAEYLYECLTEGFVPVTWNGLFDFDILAEECQSERHTAMCREMALAQVDSAFQMLCERGFMIGLDAAAKGAGLTEGKGGISGEMAPRMWAQGRAEQEKILDYVGNDAHLIGMVFFYLVSKGEINWRTRAGKTGTWKVKWWSTPKAAVSSTREKNSSLLSVEQSLGLSLPNTSWMSNPEDWIRERFFGNWRFT